MNYLVSVVLLPILVGSGVAGAALLGPLRQRAAIVESCVASGLAIAFLISFVHEVNPSALLRQLPVELKDDDAPFERWHQLGLVALLLTMVSPALALLTAAMPRHRRALEITATLLSACGVAAFVAFPGASNGGRALFAATCALSSGAIAMCGLRTAMCALAVACVGMAVCALMTGFPRLPSCVWRWRGLLEVLPWLHAGDGVHVCIPSLAPSPWCPAYWWEPWRRAARHMPAVTCHTGRGTRWPWPCRLQAPCSTE